MSVKKLEEFLVNQDIFGHSIGVHYRGDESFKTRLGSFCTLVTYVLIMFNVTTLTTLFLHGEKYETSS